MEDPSDWQGSKYPDRSQKRNPFCIHYRYSGASKVKYCQSWKAAERSLDDLKRRLDAFDDTDILCVYQTHTGKTIVRLRGSQAGEWVEW